MTKFLTSVLLALVLVASIDARTVYVEKRAVSWRNGINSSVDTGYVILLGSDTTTWMNFVGKALYQPDNLGNVPYQYIADSIFVTVKAIDVTTGADDSVGVGIVVQTRDNFNFNTDVVTISKVSGEIAGIDEVNLDSSLVGFAWGPKFWLDSGTPLAAQYRYIFIGNPAPGGGDSTKFVGMKERLVFVDQ